MGIFSKIKEKFGTSSSSEMFNESDQGYVELGNESSMDTKSKLIIGDILVQEY